MKHPLLNTLGITSAEQSRGPDPNRVPPGLNQYAGPEWRAACQHIPVSKVSVIRWWARVIARFIKLCQERGIAAFANTGEGRNSYIEDRLAVSRALFVRFCRRFDFWSDIRIRSTERTVLFNDKGFILRCWAHCATDNPRFVDWLQGLPHPYRWPKTVNNQTRTYFEHRLNSNLTIWIRRPRPTNYDQYEIGYDIGIDCWPSIPGNDLPSEAELRDFIIEVLWLPLLRALRPVTMKHRLI